MTWPAAYRIADEQVAFWKHVGVSADEAMLALLHHTPTSWLAVRRKLAAWVMQHGELWEE